MTTKTKKGASALRLNNTELRRELHRADVIIMTAVSQMSAQDQKVLELTLINCHTTERADPLAETVRLQAMHRITPKRDYSKLALIVLALILGLAWISTQTEVQILQAEAAQVQGDNHDYR